MHKHDHADYSRLRWACRRGMRELDEFFLTYLEHGFPASSMDEKLTFQRLLEHQDQEVFDWLMETAQPLDNQIAALLKRIKQTSQQQASAK